MGKTLDPNDGGQNPIEPVALALPLVMGPNNQNFRETCFDLLSHNVSFWLAKMLPKRKCIYSDYQKGRESQEKR